MPCKGSRGWEAGDVTSEFTFEPNTPGTRATHFPERKGEARPNGQRASPRAVADGGFPLRLEPGEDAGEVRCRCRLPFHDFPLKAWSKMADNSPSSSAAACPGLLTAVSACRRFIL